MTTQLKAKKSAVDIAAGAVVIEYVRERTARLGRLDAAVAQNQPDSVHQLRVTCRRLRSVLGAYKKLFDRPTVDGLRTELKWLGGELAEARDAEAMAHNLEKLLADEPDELVLGPVAARVRIELNGRYVQAHRRILEVQDSARYTDLFRQLHAFLADQALSEKGRGPAGKVLRKRVRATRRRMDDRADVVDKASDRSKALHDVRKAAKRVRYALEAVEPVFGKPAKKLRKKTRKLQRPLGDHQDMVVLRPELRRLAVSAYAAGENGFTFGRLHAIVEARAGRFEREYLDKKGTKS